MNKELVFLKGYAKGKSYWKLLEAISLADQWHSGQERKSGEPYITHPTRVASFLVSLGMDDENTLITAIMHDVVEDCGISPEALRGYGIPEEAVISIVALTKDKSPDATFSDYDYYKRIEQAGISAMLVKISDRCHNLSTMVGAFTEEKMFEYVTETYAFVFPLCDHIKKFFPEYSDPMFAMKYFLASICGMFNSNLKEPKSLLDS